MYATGGSVAKLKHSAFQPMRSNIETRRRSSATKVPRPLLRVFISANSWRQKFSSSSRGRGAKDSLDGAPPLCRDRLLLLCIFISANSLRQKSSSLSSTVVRVRAIGSTGCLFGIWRSSCLQKSSSSKLLVWRAAASLTETFNCSPCNQYPWNLSTAVNAVSCRTKPMVAVGSGPSSICTETTSPMREKIELTMSSLAPFGRFLTKTDEPIGNGPVY
mmetsp:Transcript_40631/g.63608  ORF Transcript_40631/g.63608 Transcript_40631/m.63608 type:complete len:217 (+) Transcript_40631:15-665(+)